MTVRKGVLSVLVLMLALTLVPLTTEQMCALGPRVPSVESRVKLLNEDLHIRYKMSKGVVFVESMEEGGVMVRFVQHPLQTNPKTAYEFFAVNHLDVGDNLHVVYHKNGYIFDGYLRKVEGVIKDASSGKAIHRYVGFLYGYNPDYYSPFQVKPGRLQEELREVSQPYYQNK